MQRVSLSKELITLYGIHLINVHTASTRSQWAMKYGIAPIQGESENKHRTPVYKFMVYIVYCC